MPPIAHVAIEFLLRSVRSKMFCLSRFCLLVTALHCDVGADGVELRPLVGVDPGAELPHAGGGAVQLGALLLVRQHPPGRDHNNNNKLTHHPPQRWSNYAPINMNDFLVTHYMMLLDILSVNTSAHMTTNTPETGSGLMFFVLNRPASVVP